MLFFLLAIAPRSKSRETIRACRTSPNNLFCYNTSLHDNSGISVPNFQTAAAAAAAAPLAGPVQYGIHSKQERVECKLVQRYLTASIRGLNTSTAFSVDLS